MLQSTAVGHQIPLAPNVPNTDSEYRLLQTVRTALLSWEPLEHPATGLLTLGELLGADEVESDGDMDEARLYIDAPPEDVEFPYGLMRLLASRPQGDDAGYQLRGEIEVQLFGWPRSESRDFGGVELNTAVAVSAMGDLVMQCWRDYVNTAVGDTIVAQKISIRNNVPYTEPASRDLVQVRLLLPFYATPAFLAQYSTEPVL